MKQYWEEVYKEDKSITFRCSICKLPVKLNKTHICPLGLVRPLDYTNDQSERIVGSLKDTLTIPDKFKFKQNVLSKLPKEADTRKTFPIATGVIDYFPLALAAVAQLSKAANDQHNPGEPLHWARGKSTDHDDCLIRHFIERGTIDTDGQRHSTKVAWRALALLQEELEAEVGWKPEEK